MPALLCPLRGRDVSADTRTAACPCQSGMAAQHTGSSCYGDVGENKAISATGAGQAPCWWWQLLGLSQWEKTEGKGSFCLGIPSVCCVLPGVTPASPLSPRGNCTAKGTGICV